MYVGCRYLFSKPASKSGQIFSFMKDERLICRTKRSMKENDGEKSRALTLDIVPVAKAVEITRNKKFWKERKASNINKIILQAI